MLDRKGLPLSAFSDLSEDLPVFFLLLEISGFEVTQDHFLTKAVRLCLSITQSTSTKFNSKNIRL